MPGGVDDILRGLARLGSPGENPLVHRHPCVHNGWRQEWRRTAQVVIKNAAEGNKGGYKDGAS